MYLLGTDQPLPTRKQTSGRIQPDLWFQTFSYLSDRVGYVIRNINSVSQFRNDFLSDSNRSVSDQSLLICGTDVKSNTRNRSIAY